MGVYSIESDFADRYYLYFGGRKHFGYLVKMAQKYGVPRCEQIISEMKNDLTLTGETADYKLPPESRIRWFHKVITSKK